MGASNGGENIRWNGNWVGKDYKGICRGMEWRLGEKDYIGIGIGRGIGKGHWYVG